MSRNRWMSAVVREAKKAESDLSQTLPFSRQVRAAKRVAKEAQAPLKKVRVS
ncbi:MAG: hypothetical protein AAFP28_07660 [Pseudomonadota bacterium]